MDTTLDIIAELRNRFGEGTLADQQTGDAVPTVWVTRDRITEVLTYLKTGTSSPYRMLFDLTAIDERVRSHRQGQPESDFTVLYHLLSYERNEDIRIKVALKGEHPSLPSVTRSGLLRTGMSVRSGTCSASPLTDIRI